MMRRACFVIVLTAVAPLVAMEAVSRGLDPMAQDDAIQKYLPELRRLEKAEDWPELGRYSERTLRALNADSRSDVSSIALAATYFARALEQQERYADAELLYRRAFELDEKFLGPDSPQTLGALYHLAKASRSSVEAELLYRRALAILGKGYEAELPQNAHFILGLAGSLHSQGRYAEAEPLYLRGLAILEKGNEADLQNTLALQDLASLFCDQGRYAEAVALSAHVRN
jgi:tetratricopeptide (TPR) repeat protein